MAALEHNRSSGLRKLHHGRWTPTSRNKVSTIQRERDYWHKIAAWLWEGWSVEGWSYTNTATILSPDGRQADERRSIFCGRQEASVLIYLASPYNKILQATGGLRADLPRLPLHPSRSRRP